MSEGSLSSITSSLVGSDFKVSPPIPARWYDLLKQSNLNLGWDSALFNPELSGGALGAVDGPLPLQRSCLVQAALAGRNGVWLQI
jgi:hypothetical protein